MSRLLPYLCSGHYYAADPSFTPPLRAVRASARRSAQNRTKAQAGNSTRMEPISSSNPLVQYKLLRQVGKGSYGKVYRALERSTNATLALSR